MARALKSHMAVFFRQPDGTLVPIRNIITIRPRREEVIDEPPFYPGDRVEDIVWSPDQGYGARTLSYEILYRLEEGGHLHVYRVCEERAQELLNLWEGWVCARDGIALERTRDGRTRVCPAQDLRQVVSEELKNLSAREINAVARRLFIQRSMSLWPGFYLNSDEQPVQVLQATQELNSMGELADPENWYVHYRVGIDDKREVTAEWFADHLAEELVRIPEGQYQALVKLQSRCLLISSGM